MVAYKDKLEELYDCINQGDVQGVERLIESGANFDFASKKLYSPLMAATIHGQLDVVKLLYKKGADLNLVGPEYQTALDIAYNMYQSMRRHGHVVAIKTARDIFAFLKERGAKTANELGVYQTDSKDRISQKGDTFLNGLRLIARTGRKRTVNDFIDRKLNGQVDALMAEALMLEAIQADNPDVALAFRERYMDLTQQDENGDTYLHHAVRQGKAKVVETLMNLEVDPMIENENGKGALDEALEGPYPEMLGLILKHRHDHEISVDILVNETIDKGMVKNFETILNVCKEEIDLPKAMRRCIKDKKDLKYGVEKIDGVRSNRARAEMALLLLKEGVDMKNFKDEEGTPILLKALETPDLRRIIPNLIENGAEVSSLKDDAKNTPVTILLKHRADDLAIQVMDAGCDVSSRNKKGYTPLMLAADANVPAKVIDKMIEKGADVNATGPKEGETALSIAANSGSFDSFKALFPYYKNVPEDGINGLSYFERTLAVKSGLEVREIAKFFNKIRTDRSLAHRKAKVMKRKEAVKKGLKKISSIAKSIFNKSNEGK